MVFYAKYFQDETNLWPKNAAPEAEISISLVIFSGFLAFFPRSWDIILGTSSRIIILVLAMKHAKLTAREWVGVKDAA